MGLQHAHDSLVSSKGSLRYFKVSDPLTLILVSGFSGSLKLEVKIGRQVSIRNKVCIVQSDFTGTHNVRVKALTPNP